MLSSQAYVVGSGKLTIGVDLRRRKGRGVQSGNQAEDNEEGAHGVAVICSLDDLAAVDEELVDAV